MIEELFPGLGNINELSAKCTCGCLCTATDPATDDTTDDKNGEGK